MKAGRYWIGDLCYVMHEVWDEVCEKTTRENECLYGEFRLDDGREFVLHSTGGDGEFQDQQGRRYPVDAGLIGAIRVSDIHNPKAMIDLGYIVEFNSPMESYKSGDTIVFHGIGTNSTIVRIDCS